MSNVMDDKYNIKVMTEEGTVLNHLLHQGQRPVALPCLTPRSINPPKVQSNVTLKVRKEILLVLREIKTFFYIHDIACQEKGLMIGFKLVTFHTKSVSVQNIYSLNQN